MILLDGNDNSNSILIRSLSMQECPLSVWRSANWACFCHCEECRLNCAAPIVAYIGVPLDGFRWQVGEQEGTEPAFYPSSQGVKRFFCNQCGTPMAFQAEHYPGEIHLYAATLENPQDFEPSFHMPYREKLSWLHLDDTLQRYPRSAHADRN